MKLFVATSNPGKLRDFAAAGQGIILEPLPGLATIPPPPEDLPTFLGNAQAKALYYANYAPHCIVIADDSGLEVDALQQAPGVRSARYADDANYQPESMGVDERNNAYLLHMLANTPQELRQARYRCALCASRDGQLLQTGEASIEGEILTSPRGKGGFGYDPLFFLPQHGKTMAELDISIKLSFSHRGRALQNLLAAFLMENPGK